MRTLSAGITAAIAAATVPRMIYMVRLDFDSGSLCYNTSLNTLTMDGKTYLGAGTLGSISNISASGGVKSSGVSVTLSGVRSELVVALLQEPYLNRTATIHLALLGADDSFSTTDTMLLFPGKIDSINGVQGKVPSFTVSIRSRLADWERTRHLKYTDSDQQRIYPGDRGMEYIPQISQKKLVWPRAAYLPDPRD